MTKKEFIQQTKLNKVFIDSQWISKERVRLETGIIVRPMKCKCEFKTCEGWQWDNPDENKEDVEFGFSMDMLSYLARNPQVIHVVCKEIKYTENE